MVARPAAASSGPIASTSTSTSLSAAVVPPHQHPPPLSPPSDSDERAPKKQKRVTKACDQCRRRRVKCEAFPNAPSIDSPCVVCTEQGTALECTFTRPTRKRGPQAGLTKNLAERITGLERFVGYLLAVEGEETLMVKYRAFFDQSDSTTDAAAQMAAWNRSQLPHLLENLVISPNTSSGPTTIKQEQQHLESEPGVFDVVMDGSSPANGRPSVQTLHDLSPAASASISGTASRVALFDPRSQAAASVDGANTFANPSSNQEDVPGSGSAMADSSESALQTLAHAAIPDHFFSDPFQGGSAALKDSGVEGDEAVPNFPSNSVLSLPDEAIRNQMLDVYFHQIVHPTLPILDKAQFFSWSAYLPPTNAATSIAAQALPAELYLSVFAVVAPYLHSDSTHSSETFAAAARFHLYSSMKNPLVETVQACILLAIADWGLNELSRAWILSSLSIALSITLGMHRQQQDDRLAPSPSRLRTFHAALIVHTLLSLRLSRSPIINCDDFDVPFPPSEGSENFELWRLGYNANHLRGEYGLEPIATTARRPGTVRSSTLLLFSRMASLCTLGLAVLRWSLRPGGGDHGEADRQSLVNALVAWERELPPELMIGEPSTRGADRVKERSRSIIEMHMTLHSLYARLSPSQAAVAEGGPAFSYDPAPESISMLLQLTTTTRDLFTYLRTMPLVEMALDVLVKTGLGEESSVRGAYEELGRVHRLVRREGAVPRLSSLNIATPLSTEEGYDSPIDAFAQMHPTGLVNRPPHSLASSLHGTTQPAKDSPHALLTGAEAPPVSTEPFQAFLSYSDVLGPSATVSTVLDFGSWDQSDLLVSLGLVSDPTAGSQAWHPPPSSETSGSHHTRHLPVLDETKAISLQPPMATAGATEYSHPALADGGAGPGNSHNSVGHATPLGGDGSSAAFMFDHFGQGTDLLSRWLDRGSWATGSSGEPIQGLSTGEHDLPSNAAMMLDPSRGEGIMM